MTIYEFNMLTLDQRADHVWEHGEFVANDPSVPSNFYALEQFNVEVELHPEVIKVVRIIPFITGERHDRMVRCMTLPYL